MEQRILLVTHNKKEAKEYAKSLVSDGSAFEYAAAPSEALHAVEKHLPQLILLDLHLPKVKDGFELLKKFQENPKTKDILIVILPLKV